jgi:hypothetical protein
MIDLLHGASLTAPGMRWADLPDVELAILMPLNVEIELIAE